MLGPWDGLNRSRLPGLQPGAGGSGGRLRTGATPELPFSRRFPGLTYGPAPFSPPSVQPPWPPACSAPSPPGACWSPSSPLSPPSAAPSRASPRPTVGSAQAPCQRPAGLALEFINPCLYWPCCSGGAFQGWQIAWPALAACSHYAWPWSRAHGAPAHLPLACVPPQSTALWTLRWTPSSPPPSS